jgi:2-dehydropantoate 2-reductase
MTQAPAPRRSDAVLAGELSMSGPSICIAGAGSIGCFVGGMLRAGGRPISLLARPRVIADIQANGLTVTSLDGVEHRLSAGEIVLGDDPAIMANADIILVTVKSGDTGSMADLIARHARPHAIVVSLQNGVGNVPVLQSRLPGRTVLAGMVPFNVIALGPGRFHRATSGDILIDKDANNAADKISVRDLPVRATDNMIGVQWGKLLLNLNNALNALCGLPLREQLAQREWRRLFADEMREALAAVRAESIVPVASTPLPASWTPCILELPDFAFRAIAAPMVKIDPKARSSMWEDLERGRRTEIDHLQGLIVALADKHGLKAPLSAATVALIRKAEAARNGSPRLSPGDIRTAAA